MTSPDNIPYKSLLQIDRALSSPIFLQIANQFIAAITTGRIRPNTKLPGSRTLAKLLEVHRNTVTAAYDELYGQGWIDIQPNRGAFVSATLPEPNENELSTTRYAALTGF